MRRAVSSATPSALERAQIGERDAEHEGQFLRLGAAGIMDDASVGHGKLAVETFAGQRREAAGKMRRFLVPLPRRAAGDRHGAERVVSET